MQAIQLRLNPARNSRPVIPSERQTVQSGIGLLSRVISVLLALLCLQAHAQQDASALDIRADTSNQTTNTTARPSPRIPANDSWLSAHTKRQKLLEQGDGDVILVGDSIIAGWPPKLLGKFFGDTRVINLGHPADRTEHILWRLDNHEMSKICPRLVIVMAGTNNTNGDEWTAEEIAGGVQAIVTMLRTKLPQTKVLLLGIFPRGDKDQRIKLKSGLTEAVMNPQWEKISRTNEILRSFANGTDVVYLDISKSFLDDKAALPVTLMPDLLHLNDAGYEAWGKAMIPTLDAMMVGAFDKLESQSRPISSNKNEAK